MSNDFKVLALRADEGGCGYYRVILPMQYAREEGIDVEVASDLPVDASGNRRGDVIVRRVETDADVIIFQRPLLAAFYPAIKQAQKQGITCIVELDDDLACCHPENTAHADVDPKKSPHSNWMHLRRAAEIADWCTVSTPSLAQRYGHKGRVSVVRNVLPEKTWKIEKTFPERLRVGWTGSVWTHPRDLEVVGSHVGTVMRNTKTLLSIIGDGYQVRERMHIPDDVDTIVHGWQELEDLHDAMAANIDIGLVPLENSLFNKGKSHLKGLEFAATGIPFIASGTDEYVRMSRELGIGRIARKGLEWQKYIKQLVDDRDYLLEESVLVREASSGLTYENHIGDWINAWKSALDYRAKLSAKTSS